MSPRDEELEEGGSDEVTGGEFELLSGGGPLRELGGGCQSGGVGPPERDETSGWFTCTVYGNGMFT